MRAEVQQALQAVRQGRPGEVERALGLLQDTVFSFSMKVCGHRQDAEDTMQETLLKALPYIRRFESAKALGVWLYKVAKNQCLMSRRRSRFAPQQELSLEELMPEPAELVRGDGHDPERMLLKGESAERVQRAVRQLPPDYRLVLVLHDMEELSAGEIAKITGLRPGTVRVRLHRARVFVRNLLAGRKPRRRGRAKARPSRCKRLFSSLSDYIDKEMDAARCEELEGHMTGCAPCQSFLDSLEQTVRALRRQQNGGKPGAEAAKKVRAAVMREYERVFGKKKSLVAGR